MPRDGLKDGLIDDPTRCKFDPNVLLCKGGDGADCLTAAQVEARAQGLQPGKNPRTGKELFGTLAPGSELGWAVMGGGPEPYAPILDQVKYVVFKDPALGLAHVRFRQGQRALRSSPRT